MEPNVSQSDVTVHVHKLDSIPMSGIDVGKDTPKGWRLAAVQVDGDRLNMVYHRLPTQEQIKEALLKELRARDAQEQQEFRDRFIKEKSLGQV